MVFDWKKRQNQRFGGLIPALKSNFSINLKFLFSLIMPSLLFSGLFLANYPKFYHFRGWIDTNFQNPKKSSFGKSNLSLAPPPLSPPSNVVFSAKHDFFDRKKNKTIKVLEKNYEKEIFMKKFEVLLGLVILATYSNVFNKTEYVFDER